MADFYENFVSKQMEWAMHLADLEESVRVDMRETFNKINEDWRFQFTVVNSDGVLEGPCTNFWQKAALSDNPELRGMMPGMINNCGAVCTSSRRPTIEGFIASLNNYATYIGNHWSG